MIIAKNKRGALFLSLMSYLLSGLMIYSWLTYRGIELDTPLNISEGNIEWFRQGKYDVKFKLVGTENLFIYPSINGSEGIISSLLKNEKNAQISVAYSPKHYSNPYFLSKRYYTVLEFSKNGEVIMSLKQIEESRNKNNSIAPWLSAPFFIMGTCFMFVAVRL